MGSPITTIRNLGPASERAYARAGITAAEEVHALGVDGAYARLIASGDAPHFIGYYALAMGLQGRLWTDCRGAEKDALRLRFDALVATTIGDETSALERALDALGVVKNDV